jgi:hypothetical protein
MAEELVDDQMIEIGDPIEDPAAPDPTSPQVVIEYHERGGVPWMLIPPLLVLSAVGAILLYTKLVPHSNLYHPPALAKAEAVPGPAVVVEPAPVVPLVETPAPSIAKVEPVAQPDPKVEEPPPPVAPPSIPVDAGGLPSIPVEPTIEPARAVEPAPFPRVVQGLGFDPKALEADRTVEPRADPALAPVAREDRPDDRDQPREVDPDLLPPDPRQARLRQQQRRLEILQRVEEERYRFHAELKVVCRNFREDSGPAIKKMWDDYDIKIDPKAEKVAAELLGKNGKFAGADRLTRIELLRSLGYPEPVILDNLYATYEKRLVGERDGPRHLSEAYYFSALILLRNPPRPPNPSTKAVSAPRTRVNSGGPSMPSVFGNGAAPGR